MAVAYHVNQETGDAGRCSAVKGKCPFGGENEHFSSLKEARKASEAILASSLGTTNKLEKPEGPTETVEEAELKNSTMRKLLSELPPNVAKQVTGGYLDLNSVIEITPDHKKLIDDFSQETDVIYRDLMNSLKKDKLEKKTNQAATEAYMAKASESGNDGYKNEFVLAAKLSQYEGVEVYFPDTRSALGGSPKLDIVVSYKGDLIPVSVKKNNGTQIEAHAKRSTIAEIIPGEKVSEAIEEASNRIFFFRPKFQAHGMRVGEKEKLRLTRDKKPKWAGTSIRMEYGYEDKIPKTRPTLPDEVAIEAFGGLRQKGKIKFFDHNEREMGELPTSSARVLVAGDFSKAKNLDDIEDMKEIFTKAIPVSRMGIMKAGVKVTLRVSSIGDREGDWISSRAHATDEPFMTKEKLEEMIKFRSDS